MYIRRIARVNCIIVGLDLHMRKILLLLVLSWYYSLTPMQILYVFCIIEWRQALFRVMGIVGNCNRNVMRGCKVDILRTQVSEISFF